MIAMNYYIARLASPDTRFVSRGDIRRKLTTLEEERRDTRMRLGWGRKIEDERRGLTLTSDSQRELDEIDESIRLDKRALAIYETFLTRVIGILEAYSVGGPIGRLSKTPTPQLSPMRSLLQ